MSAIEWAHVDAYMNHIKNDYKNWNNKIDDPIRQQMIREFDVSVKYGTKYIKVITGKKGSRSVHSFICLQDDKKFQCGDILKAESWKTPARNIKRGSIFDDTTWGRIDWTGPWYAY